MSSALCACPTCSNDVVLMMDAGGSGFIAAHVLDILLQRG